VNLAKCQAGEFGYAKLVNLTMCQVGEFWLCVKQGKLAKCQAGEFDYVSGN